MPKTRKKTSVPRAGASIDAIRKKIDRIDEEVLALLNQRADLCVEIGNRKARARQRIFAPERERGIQSRLQRLNAGPLKADMVQSVFREVVSACRSLEQRLRVAFLGPEGTFSHRAARDQFGSSSDLIAVDSIGQVFEEVEHGRADYGVVPVENSSEGVVTATLDSFIASPLTIKAEVLFSIRLMLLSRSGRADRVRRIVSMVQPLAQCRQWLASHFPRVPIDEVSSTAKAAEIAAADGAVAAVAGTMAQERWRLKAIASDIQDQSQNVTRFLIVGNDTVGPRCGEDKTSFLFLVRNEAGALQRVLSPFSRHGINLITLESRPLKGRPWEYVFFLDADGHIQDRRLQRAVEALVPRCVSLRVLGSYPASRMPQ